MAIITVRIEIWAVVKWNDTAPLIWQQAKTKESRAEAESIQLDYVTQDVDDDASCGLYRI